MSTTSLSIAASGLLQTKPKTPTTAVLTKTGFLNRMIATHFWVVGTYFWVAKTSVSGIKAS